MEAEYVTSARIEEICVYFRILERPLSQLLDSDPRHLLLDLVGLLLFFEALCLHGDVFFSSSVQEVQVEVVIDALFLSLGFFGFERR